MPSILSVALCAALLLVDGSYAAPTKSRLAKRSFSIERVEAGTRTLNGPNAKRRAFAKFSMTLPEGFPPHVASPQHDTSSPASSGMSGTSSAVGTRDSPSDGLSKRGVRTQAAEFLSKMTFGKNQELMIDVDTGSADVPLFSTEQPADQLGGRTSGIYDRKKSTTFQELPGESWSITYGDGSTANGSLVGMEQVDFGGVHAMQAIELASNMSPSFIRDGKSAGLLGLAFGSINQVKPTQQRTFFENLQDSLTLPIFAAALKDGTPGTYSFGQIDYPGKLDFFPIDNSKGFWQFSSPGIKVGSDATVITNAENSPAIADTGTSLILVDKSVVTGYYAKVSGAANDDSQGGYVYPCASTMPDLSLALGTSQYGTVPANLMTYTSVNDTHCYGSLQWNNAQGFQIYGDIVFKAMYVAFNIKDKTIAFGPHT